MLARRLISGSLLPEQWIRQPPRSTYSQVNMGKFWRDEAGWEKSGVLEHNSGNISETRKDRGKVTMEGL